ADNVFCYFKYKMDNTFYDENVYLVNKIKVIAIRDEEPVFEGFIYLFEDNYAIYGVEFNIKVNRMNQPFLDNLLLTQTYGYNSLNGKCTKNLLSFDFEAGVFGIKFRGRFTHVFSNYEFVESFERKTFTREIISFDKEANKKDDSFWNNF